MCTKVPANPRAVGVESGGGHRMGGITYVPNRIV